MLVAEYLLYRICSKNKRKLFAFIAAAQNSVMYSCLTFSFFCIINIYNDNIYGILFYIYISIYCSITYMFI